MFRAQWKLVKTQRTSLIGCNRLGHIHTLFVIASFDRTVIPCISNPTFPRFASWMPGRLDGTIGSRHGIVMILPIRASVLASAAILPRLVLASLEPVHYATGALLFDSCEFEAAPVNAVSESQTCSPGKASLSWP